MFAEPGDGTAPRRTQDLLAAALTAAALGAAPMLGLGLLAWSAAAVPMAVLGALAPRVPGDRWWRLPVVSALALLPAGWALGSDAPLTALTLLAAFVGGTAEQRGILQARGDRQHTCATVLDETLRHIVQAGKALRAS